MAQHFLEYDRSERRNLSEQCRRSCDDLRIKNEDGIHALHVLSFIAGGSLQGSPDYRLANRRYVLLGYAPDQLPIDLLDAMATWVPC